MICTVKSMECSRNRTIFYTGNMQIAIFQNIEAIFMKFSVELCVVIF